MDLLNVLKLVGGVCLFLFGINVMGQALERRAGNQMRTLLGKMTTKRTAGFFTGCGVTALVQSSAATTVMVVGFVNSGLMTLKQAINVIIGANVGTTITGWLLCLGGIEGDTAVWLKLIKPVAFVPVIALFGIILYLGKKSNKRKDTGAILMGFATLMFGMIMMQDSVAGLAEMQGFKEVLLVLQNPLLGVLAGAVMTAAIQSSSASVGILQALAYTGSLSYGAAIPIIMGDGIGSCVATLISSVGANKEAKRAAYAHLTFNLLGTAVWLTVFWVVKDVFQPAGLLLPATMIGVAVANTAFKLLSATILLPLSGWIERVVRTLVPDGKGQDEFTELDERLLSTPPLAIERCHGMTVAMAQYAVQSMKESLSCFTEYKSETAEHIRKLEDKTDRMEDRLGTYLVKLSTRHVSTTDSEEITELLKVIGDYERIADHSVNLLESIEEMRGKGLQFSKDALAELKVLGQAIEEVLDLSLGAFIGGDLSAALEVEPLEQVVDSMKEELRTRHILRMKEGKCHIDAGFVLSDLLTSLERVSDHCSNIAGCVVDTAQHNFNLHENMHDLKVNNAKFNEKYEQYAEKYRLPAWVASTNDAVR